MRPETPQNRPQYHRLRRMIAMVRDGMAGRRLPNRSDFRRELEVSPRTLARDLDFLRDEERAPIAYAPARHGYRLTDATYHLAPVNLSRREGFSFSLARQMLHAFEGTPLEMDMRSIVGTGKSATEASTATGHRSISAALFPCRFSSACGGGNDAKEPLPTVTGSWAMAKQEVTIRTNKQNLGVMVRKIQNDDRAKRGRHLYCNTMHIILSIATTITQNKEYLPRLHNPN